VQRQSVNLILVLQVYYNVYKNLTCIQIIKDQTNGAHLRTYYLVADDDDDDDDMKKRLLNLVVKLFACSN